MTSTDASSPHVMAARLKKADAIASTLAYHGATADQAQALPAVGRRMAEVLANVNESSDTTWTLVVATLRERNSEATAGTLRFPNWDEPTYLAQLTAQLHRHAAEMVAAYHGFAWVDDDDSREEMREAARRLDGTIRGFSADGVMAARKMARQQAEAAS